MAQNARATVMLSLGGALAVALNDSMQQLQTVSEVQTDDMCYECDEHQPLQQ